MVGHHSHPHFVRHHEHHAVTDSTLLGQVLCVAYETGHMQGNVLLVQGGGHQSVQISGHEVPDGSLQGDQRGLSSLWRGLARIDTEIVQHAVYDVDPL